MTANSATPLAGNDRADILDILRGFALLGVLIDNTMAFTGYGFYPPRFMEEIPTFPVDRVVLALELIFVHGKFYSLFSLLFGIGFSIILTRNQAKGVNPLPLFYRRLLVLALFGLAHMLLLWEGDILLLYALLGCLLPLFRHFSNRNLLILGISLILLPIVIDILKLVFQFKPGAWLEAKAIAIDKANGVPLDDTYGKYLFTNGAGWEEWRNWQESGWLYRFAYLLDSNRFPKVLGMFLLGFYVGRNKIYADLSANLTHFRKIRKFGFLVGIPFSISMLYFFIDGKNVPGSMLGLMDTISYAFSVVPLSLAYAATLAIYYHKRNGVTRWRVFAPVGRMALTNYISQTVICILIFYGLGLGLAGNIGPSYFFPAAFLIYALQVGYSNLWFRNFNFGPLEWIWRMLTYGSWLPIRKKR